MFYVRLTLAVLLFDLSVFLIVDKLLIQLTISVFFFFFFFHTHKHFYFAHTNFIQITEL